MLKCQECGKELILEDIDIEDVRRMLGHSSLRTTQIYLQCKRTNLREIAMKLEGNITQCVIQ